MFNLYLILKIFHVGMIISWFAGLFYLPRIFVNLAMVKDNPEQHSLLIGMATRLFRFMTPIAALAFLSGLSIIFLMGFSDGWVHGKITIGVLLCAYHAYCYKLLKNFKLNQNTKSDKWYRAFNELPVILMFLSLYLVIYKPF